jgi:hypothetical protein
MSGQPSSKAPSPMPPPLLWAIAACLIALAAIAIIAVARVAGFDPQQLISLIREIESVLRSVRA